jgi:outer membrane protein OmpA-like peptidoglycan-associated protein
VKSFATLLAVLVCLGAGTIAQAQTANSRNQMPPVYGTNVVSRTTRAVQYEHRSGSTKVDFKGTNLMPRASGEAEVESKRGTMEIQAEFKGLNKPTSFGTEYLTYVLWAISPEGRSINVGEVLVDDDHDSKLKVTTDLQAFALIVTAEPYFAVRRPSNVVILENAIRSDTEGTSEAVNAKYELIDRGGYIPTGYRFDPVVLNAKLPLEFFEARNAVRIAESAGAETYAASSYEKAMAQMKRADSLATARNVHKKELIAASREAVQTADDAREISVKRIEADRLDAAKNAEAAKLEDANRRRADADRATAQARRLQQDALAESDRNRAIAADANQATAEARQAQNDAEAEAERSRLAAAASDQQLAQAVQDREELRAKLLQQFNLIFATRDTARGLIVNLSDVLFDTGKSTLLPGAREKLAKISGIVLAYPDLRLGIEGYTDSVGSDAMNQQLSEQRADSVRDYLAQQNIPATSMTSQGFGETQPVASNDTAAGRQQNRRVELVVSGDIIGTTVGVASQNLDNLALPLR